MHDVVYLRGLADRYRKLARRFRPRPFGALECLPDLVPFRDQRPIEGMPIVRVHNR
jgi:hypothetical protein